MAGFFYLGGRDQDKQDHHQSHPGNKDQDHDKTNNYLYLYKDEIYNANKGFEIWPPQYFHQQQQHEQAVAANYYSFGMVPSGSSGSNHNNNHSTSSRPGRSLYFNVVSDEPLRSTAGGFTVTRQGGMNCQDCGNQAKKDCPHLRCRTCCKSRGFVCQTHVKSTWVPAAKRRERQAQLAALQNQQAAGRGDNNVKRLRDPNSGGGGGVGEDDNAVDHGGGGDDCGGGGSALACTRLVNANSSGLEVISHFPPEVSSPAVFRCVRVSSIDDADEEYAYQTAVNIGGHVFKGILYDQGPEHRYNSSPNAGETSQQHLNLLASTAAADTDTATTTAVTIVTAGNNSNTLLLDPSSLYPAPLNAFIAGTQFFPPPRS